MRHMKEPRNGHMVELKRTGRYLIKTKRCVVTYPRQTVDASLQVDVDSDWAGDLLGIKITVRRKSNSNVFGRCGHSVAASHSNSGPGGIF